VALAVQALLLPRVQDQTSGIALVTTNGGEAPVQVGGVNGMEIEMLEIPTLGTQRPLRDGPVSDRKWRLEHQSDEPQASGGVAA